MLLFLLFFLRSLRFLVALVSKDPDPVVAKGRFKTKHVDGRKSLKSSQGKLHERRENITYPWPLFFRVGCMVRNQRYINTCQKAIKSDASFRNGRNREIFPLAMRTPKSSKNILETRLDWQRDWSVVGKEVPTNDNKTLKRPAIRGFLKKQTYAVPWEFLLTSSSLSIFSLGSIAFNRLSRQWWYCSTPLQNEERKEEENLPLFFNERDEHNTFPVVLLSFSINVKYFRIELDDWWGSLMRNLNK